MKQICKSFTGFMAEIATKISKDLEEHPDYSVLNFTVLESGSRYQALVVFNIDVDTTKTKRSKKQVQENEQN